MHCHHPTCKYLNLPLILLDLDCQRDYTVGADFVSTAKNNQEQVIGRENCG